jgi:AmmeMemoRadiSam system protein B
MIVSSFHDCVEEGREPKEQEDISRIIEALRRVERETNESICYIISGDLAHIGPFFDEKDPLVNESILKDSHRQDQAIIQQAELADASEYFRIIEEEKDARRICGLPPTYVVLEAAKPRKGKLLHYSQYVHPRGEQSVSFASMGFE